MEKTAKDNNDVLFTIVETAIKIPGAKIDRETSLRALFKDQTPEMISLILDQGPVEAGISKEELRKKAQRIVNDKTLTSTGASFLAGIPGGLAMAITIPADVAQFYAVALLMAQELAYLYGEEDLWKRDILEADKITNQLILYCGAMLGVTGAAQSVRIMAGVLAKQAMKKIPQQALTKTFYYPIVKSVAKAFGAKMTKSTFAKGISKAVPIIGGVISGGMTLLTMQPMGMRLVDTFEEAKFSYDQTDFEADLKVVVEESGDIKGEELGYVSEVVPQAAPVSAASGMFEEINKAKQLLEQGIISESEFTEMKLKIIRTM